MRLTESAVGVCLLVLSFVLAIAGLVADILAQGDPAALFGTAAVAGIASIGVGLDEHRRALRPHRLSEVLLGRGLLVLAIALACVSFVLAIGDSAYRNLWLGLAIIVDLVGVAVVVDSHRLVLARAGALPTRSLNDALLGAIASALALGCGVAGLLAGLGNIPHAAAFLELGVILSILAVALMFDEQAHVVSRIRKGPFG
jgi:hypothetical protein